MDVNGRGESAGGRSSGWEPLALGVTAVFIGLLAVGASAINSRTTARNFVSGPVWGVLTAIAVVTGAGALIAWITTRRRWRPGPLIGAIIGVVALVGAPLEAYAVRPHSVRAQLVAIDAGTGKRLWNARPPLLNVTGNLSLGRDLTVVASGADVASRCGTFLAEVRIDPRTGRQLGPTMRVNPNPYAGPAGSWTDGVAVYELVPGPTGEALRASVAGAIQWETSLAPGPPPVVSAGSGVVVVDSGLTNPRSFVAVPPPSTLPSPATAPSPATPNGLRILDAASGHDLWSDSSAGGVGAAIADGAVWLLSPDGTLSSHDPRTGAVRATVTVPLGSTAIYGKVAPGLWSAGGTLLTTAAGEIVALGTDGGVRWRAPLPGSGVDPFNVVTAGSTVIVGIDGRAASGCNTGE